MPNQARSNSSREPKSCFVIGPIGERGGPDRRLADFMLNGLIRPALAEPEFKFDIKRADEDPRPGMINDRVITDLMKADLVIADLTNLNPNAFYELGIRHCVKLPTIHLALAGTKLPFDNMGHSVTFVDLADWSDLERARSELAQSVKAAMADGYVVNNPVTQANATFEMRHSADPRERMLAEMQSRIADLETTLPRGRARRPSFVPDDEKYNNEVFTRTLESRLAGLAPADTVEKRDEIKRIAIAESNNAGLMVTSIDVAEYTVAVETERGRFLVKIMF